MNRPIEKSGALDLPGIVAGRLAPETCAVNFSDAHPPLNALQAMIEAERCYYCYNAPCIEACPTGINIPHFIQRIAQENLQGAAETILESNVLGGMCARVCPTENLCEGSCVRNTNESKPVEIGLLQRFATDAYFAEPGRPIFTRSASTGRRIAVVGAGPAGLSAAHRLAVLGNDVVIFDAHSKPGGLNEYGLARYKTPGDFAQREIDWLLSIGGIELRCGKQLGRDMTLTGLVEEYDAVFLGMGLAGVNALGIAEQQLVGLRAAVDFISELRQTHDLSVLPVGRRVVVIGGGMTAVDAAVQARKLGAREVTIVYRRGAAAMSASAYEQQWAQINGVSIRHWATPREIVGTDGVVTGAVFAVTREEDGRLVETGETFTLEADMVLKAIGQSFVAEPLNLALAMEKGRIATDASGQTSHPKIWAGGDCRAGGLDLTVEAVEHGKLAAIAIDAALRA